MFEVDDLLVLCEKISLVICNIILQYGLVTHFWFVAMGLCLQTLNELFFVLIKIFNQRLESLHLLFESASFLPPFVCLFLANGKVSLLLGDLVLLGLELLFQIVDLNLLLVLAVLLLNIVCLARVYLVVQRCNLGPGLLDFNFESSNVRLKGLSLSLSSNDFRVFQDKLLVKRTDLSERFTFPILQVWNKLVVVAVFTFYFEPSLNLCLNFKALLLKILDLLHQEGVLLSECEVLSGQLVVVDF